MNVLDLIWKKNWMRLFFIISFKVLCCCAVCSLTLDLSSVTTSASSMTRGHLETMQLMEIFLFFYFFKINSCPSIMRIKSLFPPILWLVSVTCNLCPRSGDTCSVVCETSLFWFFFFFYLSLYWHAVFELGPPFGVTLFKSSFIRKKIE